jgi:uncharacterized coiled-coil protein SlyX
MADAMRQRVLEEKVGALEARVADLESALAHATGLEERLTGMKQQLAMHTGQLNTLRAKAGNGDRNAAAR